MIDKFLTQEIIEELFYDFIAEMRKQNIPILNDFKEVFAHIKYEEEIKAKIDKDKINSENSEDSENSEIYDEVEN